MFNVLFVNLVSKSLEGTVVCRTSLNVYITPFKPYSISPSDVTRFRVYRKTDVMCKSGLENWAICRCFPCFVFI